MRVDLDKADWDRIVYVISNAHGPGISWMLTNPLLAELTRQLNAQPVKDGTPQFGVAQHTNSGELKPQ